MIIFCENCVEETDHHIIKEKSKGSYKELLVKCSICNCISTKELHQRTVKLPVILSWLNKSVKTYAEFDSDEVVCIGDEFIIRGNRCIVTSIEKNGKRCKELSAKLINTLWVKRYDKASLKISINFPNGKTSSYTLIVDSDHEFSVGSKLKIGKLSPIIKKIKTKTGFKSKDTAKNIVRVYCSIIVF